jgi:hypothetical protein
MFRSIVLFCPQKMITRQTLELRTSSYFFLLLAVEAQFRYSRLGLGDTQQSIREIYFSVTSRAVDISKTILRARVLVINGDCFGCLDIMQLLTSCSSN